MTESRFRAPRVTSRRRAWQRLQEILTFGHWPARVARALGGQRSLSLVEERFDLAAPGPGRAPLRVAFASDFHAGPCTHPSLLDLAQRELSALEAPVLLLGGDFVCVSSRDIAELAPRLAEIPAPLGKFAVLGNHDYWAGAGPVARALEAAGIHVLVNESVRLPPPFEDLWICGLDDPISGHPDAGRALGTATGNRLVLMHSPSGLGAIRGMDFRVAFCGHTHGGQVALPGPIPLYVPEAPEFRRYAQGRFEIAPDRSMLVTRGVGYSTAPIRTFCPPEIVSAQVEFVAPASRPPRDSGAQSRTRRRRRERAS